jgi:agmatinase
VREASHVLESYSPYLQLGLDDIALSDWGDVPLLGLGMDAALDAISQAVERAAAQGLPLLIGGEHTVTVGAVRGAHKRYPNLVLVHVDAHLDLRDEYEGLRTSHATVIRRVADEIGLERIAQCGIRSGTREEFEVARRCLWSGPGLQLDRAVRDRIRSRPVYLTIDIDVLDPAVAPGTGCPEPGGATFVELLALIHSLRELRVVAVDVTEVLPAADVNDVTSVAAAKIIREAALAFTPRRGAATRDSSAISSG